LISKPKLASHTSLTVRGLAPGVKQRLRERAARHGRSLEAEVREILQGATAAPGETAWDRFQKIRARLGPLGFGEIPLPSRQGFEPPDRGNRIGNCPPPRRPAP
jgi:plasmid stability protein